jgi:hypothetical protein
VRRQPSPPQDEFSPSGWSAVLSVVGPDGHRSSFPFRPPALVVGRKRPADLALPDQGVSSTHCEFLVEDGWFLVRDLDSGNGTFVNEQRIGRSGARLRDGDVVRIGASKLTVVLQGEVQGAPRFTLQKLRRHWMWLASGALLLALGVGAGLVRHETSADEARLRGRWAAAVRAQVQVDTCQLASDPVAQLKQIDQRIGGRPVPMASPGRRLSPADQQSGVELLGLYRQKSELYALALAALVEDLQKERDGLEKIGRMGARLEGRDRKISFWAEGQLAERVAKGEAFRAGLQQLSRETARFAALVDAVSVRGEQQGGPELAAFRFSADPAELLRQCQSDVARTTSGALGALNALDDE